MLDTCFHQGAGLHSYTPQSELRVLAMVSQTPAPNEPELLWQLCSSLQRLGYPVIVLDGTDCETEASPGLHQLLGRAPWQEFAGLSPQASASSVAVLPAALGLSELAHRMTASAGCPLQGLLPCFRAYGLLVLHAPASMLGPLLTHTATPPLIVVEPGASGVLACYKNLKQIALDAGLPCTVAAVMQDDSTPERQKTASALQALQQCADRHLGGRMQPTTITANNSLDIQRLALQLLENAGTIGGSSLPPYPLNGVSLQHCVRSH